MSDPHEHLKAWLPHLILMVVLALGVWLLVVVFLPVLEPILLAAALAMLTTSVLFQPLDRRLQRLFPRLEVHMRRQAAGVIATLALVAITLAPMLLLLVGTIGSVGDLIELGWGIAVGDLGAFERLRAIVAEQVLVMDHSFPALDLPSRGLPELVVGTIKEMTNFGPAALSFIFTGGGAIIEVLLALVTLAFLYPQGPRLVRGLLHYSPLDDHEIALLQRRHRQVVGRLLADTVALAVVKAVVLGMVIWLVDRTLGTGRLPVLPITILAGVVSLLPLVGAGMIWVPLAGILWGSGHQVGAVVLGLASLAQQVFLTWLHSRLSRQIDVRGSWMSFLLFLGLIGGMLTFGPIKGFIIGPMAVVLVFTLGSFWLPLYGLGERPSLAVDPMTGDAATSTRLPTTAEDVRPVVGDEGDQGADGSGRN